MTYPPGFTAAPRNELDRLELQVIEGSLPRDLQGHVFVVGPVGNVGTKGFPTPSHDSALSGDGMIYRLDFGGGRAAVRARLVRSADFYTDLASERDVLYAPLSYTNAGIVRVSPLLGARNLGNTAFMGFKLGANTPRLAVTFDGGRPLELDVRSLNVVTPVGAVDEWRAEALSELPFPPILSTAHPAVDEREKEIFLVNYGRSIASITSRTWANKTLAALPHALEEMLSYVTRPLGLRRFTRRWARSLSKVVSSATRGLARLFQRHRGALLEDFLYLVRWDGLSKLSKRRVLDERLRPVSVLQTMHQIAMTEHWVVLMDTSMKVTLDQTFNSPLGKLRFLERALRAATTSPQRPYTRLYLIRRADLSHPTTQKGEPCVKAQVLDLEMEAVHFLADYDDAADVITLHVAHDCAQDVAEWVRDFDLNQFSTGRSPEALWGVPNVTPLDVHRLARYRIHGPTGEVREKTILCDRERMWGLSLYGGAGINTLDHAPKKLRGMFHVALGFQPDLVTRFIYDLYADYKFREVPLREIDQIGKTGGKPAAIFYVDLDTYEVKDWITLEGQSMAGAIQFVPKPGASVDEPRNGYLIAMVIEDGKRQVWVLDAANLRQGPICRLAHREFVFGATLHSFYLASLAARAAAYHVSLKDDYGPRVSGRPLAEGMFEEHVYPRFP